MYWFKNVLAATMTLDEDNDTKSNILAATMAFGEEDEHNKSNILDRFIAVYECVLYI